MYGLNSQGQAHFNTGISGSVIATVAVGIRIFCKLRYKAGIHADDYWMISSLGLMWLSTALIIWGLITGGGGVEMQQMFILALKDARKLKQIEHYLEGLFIAYTFYLALVFTLKMSILCFYRHLFSVKTLYRNMTWVAIGLSVAWFVAAEIANLVTCRPVDAFWHRLKPGKCFNFNVMSLWLGSVEAVIDFFILAIPVHMAFDLHLPTRTRIAVAGIFALGGFSIVTNVVRIKFMYVPGSRFVNWNKSYLWLHIHCVTAIICACLPIYKKLFASAAEVTGRMFSSFRSLLGTYGSSKGGDTSYILEEAQVRRQSSQDSNATESKERDDIRWTSTKNGTFLSV